MIVVVFIWDKKGTEFNYSPNSRLLKNIRIKDRVFSDEALFSLQSKNLDTSIVSKILRNGDADMWNKVKIGDCTQYQIKGERDLKYITLTVKNCKSTAFVEKVIFE